MPGGRVHWFSILNSLMVVLVMSSIVAMIMLRTIRRDLARYESILGDGGMQFLSLKHDMPVDAHEECTRAFQKRLAWEEVCSASDPPWPQCCKFVSTIVSLCRTCCSEYSIWKHSVRC